MQAELTLKLRIIREDGTEPDAREVETRLRNAAEFLVGNGLLTGDSEDVLDWHATDVRLEEGPLLQVDVAMRIWRRVGLRVVDPTVDIDELKTSLTQMESGYIEQLPQVVAGQARVEIIEDLTETVRPLSREEFGWKRVVFITDVTPLWSPPK